MKKKIDEKKYTIDLNCCIYYRRQLYTFVSWRLVVDCVPRLCFVLFFSSFVQEFFHISLFLSFFCFCLPNFFFLYFPSHSRYLSN